MSDYPKLPPESYEGQPQQQPPYPQAQGGATVVQQSQVISGPGSIVWGELPQNVTCQYCGQEGVTEVEKVSSNVSWLICLAMFGAGFFLIIPWFICCLPFCLDICKNNVHRCRSCHRELGKKPALGINM